MSRLFLSLLVIAFGLITMPCPGEACSPASDVVLAPDNEMPYDAALAPPAPEVVLFQAKSPDAAANACVFGPGCGAYNIRLDLQVEVDSTHFVRVDGLPDEGPLYFLDSPNQDGIMIMIAPGDWGVTEPIPVTVTLIDQEGNPSLPVDATLLPSESGGCRVGGSGPTSIVLILLALACTRLRFWRRAPSAPRACGLGRGRA